MVMFKDGGFFCFPSLVFFKLHVPFLSLSWEAGFVAARSWSGLILAAVLGDGNKGA